MVLGCFELCVPGDSLAEKLAELESHGMWIEIAYLEKRGDLDILNSFNVKAESVQAYGLHNLSLISSVQSVRKEALQHVKETIDIAGFIGAERVITIPSYGYSFVKNTFRRAVDVFNEICEYALDFEVQILVETLSPKKTSFLPSLDEVANLVNMISYENIWLLADTGHLYDMGSDVQVTIQEFEDLIKEIHLKGEDSEPPLKGNIPLNEVWNKFKEIPICLEYKSNNQKEDFLKSITHTLSET